MHPRHRTPHIERLFGRLQAPGSPRNGLPLPARRTRLPGALLALAAVLAIGARAAPPAFAQADSLPPAAAPALETPPALDGAAVTSAPPATGSHSAASSGAVGAPPTRPAATAPVRPAEPVGIAPPRDLRHVKEWVDYRLAAHVASLPAEARLFYRRGLMAHQSGQHESAVLDVRGAADLDPSFVEPHLTLAAWTLLQDPSQALLQYATVVDLLRQSFPLQMNLAANAAILLLEALFFGMLAAACMLVWLRRRELTHPWREGIARFASRGGARWWAPALMILPYLTGFGLTLPTLLFLGCLWPHLRIRERALFVSFLAIVVSMPLSLRVVERASLPLHVGSAPFFDIPALENEPWDAGREARLQELAATHDASPLLHFALGWTARRGSHLGTAERAYRRTLELRPADDRAWNNLGNVLAMAGRPDEALGCYEKAIAANPKNAAASFNASQLYTQRYEYAKASEYLSKASAINFELVKSYQSRATADGLLPLVDEWLAPAVFWRALVEARLPGDLDGSLPVLMRRRIEASGWSFSVAALLLAAAGLAFGVHQQRSMPLRACSNCGAVVCRRCAERRREHALCPACARIETAASSRERSRVALLQFGQSRRRRLRLVRMALAMLVPGYGILAQRHAFSAAALLSACWVLGRAWLGAPPPYAIEPRMALSAGEFPPVLLFAGLLLVLAVSILRYLELAGRAHAREAALAAAQGARVTQSTRRVDAAAA